MWRELWDCIKKVFKNESGFYSLGMARAAADSARSQRLRELRDQYRCENCSGKGERIVDESKDANGRTVRYAPCRICFGHGVQVKPCPKCQGKKVMTVKKYIETGAIIKKECHVCKGKKQVACHTCHNGQLKCGLCAGVGELEVKEVLEKNEIESCDGCRATGFAPVFYENI